MAKYLINQDLKQCIGCYSCEVHCKAAKQLAEGPRICRIYAHGPTWEEGIPRMAFVFMTCVHCEKAWCVDVCPSGAMRRRPEDGVVFVDQEACIGCKLCLYACPWGIPQYDERQQVVHKCDLCKDRLDQGLEPACVAKCVTGCLSLQTTANYGKTGSEK